MITIDKILNEIDVVDKDGLFLVNHVSSIIIICMIILNSDYYYTRMYGARTWEHGCKHF